MAHIEKGIFVGPSLLRQGISRGCRECELFFQLKSLQEIINFWDLKLRWPTSVTAKVNSHGKIKLTHGKIKLTHGKIKLTHGKIMLTHGKIKLTRGKIKLTK